MIVYLYDYSTRLYLGEQQLDVTDCDPRAPGRMLIPGNATLVPPPRCSKGLWPAWHSNELGWGLAVITSDPLDDDYYLNM